MISSAAAKGQRAVVGTSPWDGREGRMRTTGAGMFLIGLGEVAAMLTLAGSGHAENCGRCRRDGTCPQAAGCTRQGPGPSSPR